MTLRKYLKPRWTRECTIRRRQLLLEALESRDCPTFSWGFDTAAVPPQLVLSGSFRDDALFNIYQCSSINWNICYTTAHDGVYPPVDPDVIQEVTTTVPV